MHIPKYIECGDSEKLVIFVHGFMGTPDHFDDLVETALEKECAVLTVLLPGHGGSVKDFIGNGLTEWEMHLQNEINKYKDRYSRIFLAGHSMGGLLALNASVIRSNKICGVLTLSSPMKIKFINPKSALTRIKLLTLPNGHEIKKCYVQSYGLTAGGYRYYLLWLKPALQFMKLMRKTRRKLAEVFVPVAYVHSKRDETVSFKSARILYDGLSNTHRKGITLSQSWHVFYTEEEREIIRDELISLIK